MSDQRPDAEQPPQPPGSGAPRHWWNASRLRYALIAVVALAGVSLSVASYTLSRDAEIERAAAAFAIDAHIRVAAVEDTLAQDIGALQSIGAFYTASMAVTRDEFNLFTGAILRMNSSISQLAWLPHVPGNERGAFEQAAHADGLTAFEFRDLTASLMPTTAPERESYLPV
jgi:CHASE1-domain containing sensor protein